jgi:hypothetical protein
MKKNLMFATIVVAIATLLIIVVTPVFAHYQQSQPSPTSGTGFNFKRYLFDPLPTLSISIVQKNPLTGFVSITGVDTATPSLPFTWDWGDGTVYDGWFPQSHTYSNKNINYIVIVTAHYSGGITDSTKVLVRFVNPTLNPITLPSNLAVTIPNSMPTLGTHYYSVPTGLTYFDNSFFPDMPRSSYEYVLSVSAYIQNDMVNGDVYKYNNAFNQVILRNPSLNGMNSLWFTDPVSFASGDYGFQGTVQYSSFFHEMGHNFTLNSPENYYYGGKIDGNANAIFSESMANIFAHATIYELLNNLSSYGIGSDIAWEIEDTAIDSIIIVRQGYDNYVAGGKQFHSWNDPATGPDETFNTFMTIAYKFLTHAENDGQGYHTPLKRMMLLLQKFNPDWRTKYSQYANTSAAETFRATLMVAAMSYGFNSDLRAEFRSLNFPISDTDYNDILSAMDPPGGFNKLSPANGATGQSTSPTLTWGTSSNVTRYDYCYDTTNDNACSNWTNNGTSTSKALSGLANSTTYYWHVRAVNANGTTYSNGSSTIFFSFTTQAAGSPPGAFNKSSPSNGATGQSTSPTLTWGTSSGATRYDYCYDTTNDNACSNWTNNGTATSKALSGLANSTTYYWHVRAVNANGTTYSNGSSTAFFSFTTQAAGSPPGAFSKSSPSNGATGQSISPALTWGASSGATSYDYCFDTSNDGACSNWTSNGNATSKTLNGLAYSTTYYWHIRANNAYGTTYSNGGYWSFTTQANNPGGGNYYQPFSTDVIGSGEWSASNASVTVNTSGGYLNIATDGANDAYAEKSFSYSLPVIVETRMRLNGPDNGYYAPWLTVLTNASNIGISYTYDLGWAFNGFTSITTKAPSIGNWITVKAVIRADGGELWAKYDGEANFTKITTSAWSISQVMGIRFMQPWDSNCQMDYVQITKVVTKSFASTGTHDGWVLESAEGSNKGGTLNSSATTLYVGDDSARRQYRSILSFATATLPDNAVILSVKLKVKKQGITGTNPFTTHKPLLFDIRNPYIGTNAQLAAGDFQAGAQYSGGTFSAALVNGWYTATLKSAAYQYLNKTGNTQFRLRFKLDDDNDVIADILKLYSGNYSNSAYRPLLVVEYYVP